MEKVPPHVEEKYKSLGVTSLVLGVVSIVLGIAIPVFIVITTFIAFGIWLSNISDSNFLPPVLGDDILNAIFVIYFAVTVVAFALSIIYFRSNIGYIDKNKLHLKILMGVMLFIFMIYPIVAVRFYFDDRRFQKEQQKQEESSYKASVSQNGIMIELKSISAPRGSELPIRISGLDGKSPEYLIKFSAINGLMESTPFAIKSEEIKNGEYTGIYPVPDKLFSTEYPNSYGFNAYGEGKIILYTKSEVLLEYEFFEIQ